MTDPSPLPPECRLRPAHSTDSWSIQKMLLAFDREVSPPPMRQFQRARYLAIGAVVAIAIYWFRSLSIQTVLLILLYAVAILAIGLVVLFCLAWFSKDWANYWVVECNGHLVACAKLCKYRTHSAIFNVFVAVNWRHRGIGSGLVQRMIQEATRPLYLACFTKTAGFYQRLGFVQLQPKELSPILRYELGLSNRLGVVPMKLT